MKTIIAGSRTFDNHNLLNETLYVYRKQITEVVSGCARGADTMGEEWAAREGIPCKRFPADWKTHGKKAGILRNQQMADYADMAIVFWDGTSKGTKNMIDEMQWRSKDCVVVCYDKTPEPF